MVTRKESNVTSLENHYGHRKMVLKKAAADPFVEFLFENDLIRCSQIASNPAFERIVNSLMALKQEIYRGKKQLKNRDPSLGLELIDHHKNVIERKSWVLKHTS